ncbi:MAG: tRNA (guanosine(46)-N7)-methyltransferase TrmB [Clostridia bacterium]|nr:tRNA (guanosine(46)-N7)-methyltransferase TrmB [Clostridia bacterium]
MRMRPKKHREERLSAVEDRFAVFDGEGRLDIASTFGAEYKKLYYEFGCGKGAFCCALAQREPESAIVAVEKVRDVLLMAMEKAAAAESANLRFCNFDLEHAADILPPQSADAIYLNFSDPWPRKRHAKRRLTSPAFLERYKLILKKGGVIYFKTDNAGLFEYSLETFAQCGYKVNNVCRDLHADEKLSPGNIETEYEKNFTAKGFKINYLEATL